MKRIPTLALCACCWLGWTAGNAPVLAAKPAYMAPAWIRTGGPLGGLGYDIRYRFSNPNTWYVTDSWAGFYVSTDDGLTWLPSNTGVNVQWGPAGDTLTIFSATVDPHDPDILWIGTQHTGQIFRSADGGHTWEEKINGIDQGLRPLSFRGFTVDPRTSDIVYAMAEIGSTGWTPDGSERKGVAMDLTQGIVYRTTNGGASWTQIWRGDNLARYCWIDPRDPDVLYISTGIFDREAANTAPGAGFPDGVGGVGILKSIDGGASWAEINQTNGLLDLYVGSLYMHPENPDVLLAAASNGSWWDLGSKHTAGVFITENAGETWQRVLEGEIFTSVEVCTSDTRVAYAGSSEAIYRSDNGGFEWQRFGRPDNTWGSPGVIAGWPIDMQCDPRDSMRIFVNNYLGGNFLSTDGGQTWVAASKGYTGEEVRQVAVASGRPWAVITGGRVGVFRSDNGGGDWAGLAYPPEGTGMRLNEITTVAVDPADADHLLAAPADVVALVESRDGGKSWSVAPLPGSGFSPVDVAYGRSDPRIAYAAVAPFGCRSSLGVPPGACDGPGTGVYVSSDAGSTWQPADGSTSELANTAALSVAVDPHDANVAYVGTHSRGLFQTKNRGQSWTHYSAGLPPVPIVALAVDSQIPARVFAGTAGASIWRRTDDDLDPIWSASGNGLDPEAFVRSLVIDPTDDNVLYAGDHFTGVYYSTDGGTSWAPLRDGMDHRAVTSLALSDNGSVLYAGIFGAGVYRLGGANVTWDLQPCTYPNSFNCKRRRGVVAAALFGSEGLDVTAIDNDSLRLTLASNPLGPAARARNTKPADIGSAAYVDAAACGAPDGFLDLEIGFEAMDVSALIGCPLGKEGLSEPLTLQGNLLDGTPLLPASFQIVTDVAR